MVITPDILLAAAVVAQNAHALNPLGEFYSQENIKERLAMRDLMEELLNAGQLSGGPAAFGVRVKQDFAYMDVGKGREHDYHGCRR